jgi:hypothetical protein
MGSVAVLLAVISGAIALSAPSQAQGPSLAVAYGGGALGSAQSEAQQVASSLAVALAPAGDTIRARISLGMVCAHPSVLAYDDLVVRVPLHPDGTFGGVRRVKSVQLGSARVDISGAVSAVRADGSVDVRTLKGKLRCRSLLRPFEAKPVDPGALAAGKPPTPGALLVGLSNATAAVPFAVVARISSDGAEIEQIFDTQVAHCVAKGRRARRLRFSGVDHDSHAHIVLTDGSATRTSRSHESAAERRRGIRSSRVQELSVRVTDAGMVAKVRTIDRLSRPGYSDRCVGGPTILRAVPA